MTGRDADDASFEELWALWEAVLSAAGLDDDVEVGHEDDVSLEDIPEDVLDAAMRRFELGG